jgi:uncharacterized protein YbjT (DUF2867 family)
MPIMSRILVIGASGTVGSELSRQLAAAGHTVRRATSRPPEAPDQVPVDLLGGQGLGEALGGMDAAFLLAPPGHVNQDALLKPAIDAARAAGVGKVVLMSAMGADADENAPLRKAERHLEASGLAWNVIRPNWFMQNFHTFWLHGIREAGTIALPVGRARGSFIDTRDIAAVAARLLTQRGREGQAFDLTGAEALDHDEVAAVLARETGRAIRFQDITPEAMRQGLLAAGLPGPYSEFLVTILGYFKAGYAERTTPAVAEITGQAPRRFAAYAHEHRAAWLA